MVDDLLEVRTKFAMQICERMLADVRQIIHQPFGHAGITFEVVTGAKSYILKTSDKRSAFEYTSRNIEILGGLGIPVPKVVSSGAEDGIEYLLNEKIPGRDLGFVLGEMTEPHMTELARRIVEIQRMVATLPIGQGYGWTPIGVRGPFANWSEIVCRNGACGGVDVLNGIESMADYLQGVSATCFLDDITMKNVIVDLGELQGIVDLDFVCYGDPLYMLALTETTAVLDVGFVALFYGNELRRFWGLSKVQEQATALYSAIHASSFLARTDIAGPSRERMQKWLSMNLEKLPS